MSAKRIAVLIATVAALAVPFAASADHNAIERLSTGPVGGNGAIAAAFAGSSIDGGHVYFQTSERLTADDTDTRIDVYERSGGATILVSTGAIGGNGGFNAFFAGSSADGSKVFFGTAEKLTGSDSDSQTDIYERSGGSTALVSTGATGGNGAFPAFFDGASADGSVVLVRTTEKLEAVDLDSQTDIYQRSGGSTTLVSTGAAGGNGAFPATFGGVSHDGSRVFFETQEALELGDSDASFDVYERSGSATALISTGSAAGASDAFFDGASSSGASVFFSTDAALEPADGDDRFDVYRRTGGTTTLISTGSSAGGAFDALFGATSADGARVVFQTDEPLEAGDGDAQVDVYERSGGATTLQSTGSSGGDGPLDASFAGASADAAQVLFETEESLEPADSDAEVDVYQRSGAATTLISGGPGGGNGPFDAFFSAVSDDGQRAFFQTEESLASPDSDSFRDVYERSGSVTTRVSGGFTGGNGFLHASFAGSSADGDRVFVATNEKLVVEDTDAVQDLYSVFPGPAGYPRPGGATPIRVPLLPAFTQCTNPNSMHVPPLDAPSCSPPVQESPFVTTSPAGRGNATLRLDVVVGNPATPEDEADIRIFLSTTDIRTPGQQTTDYLGKLLFTTELRITDRANGTFETTPATVQDARFQVPINCAFTEDQAVGATCNLNLTTDVLVPGFAKEGKRAVISALDIGVLDAGADGVVVPGSGGCPPTCGTGDENRFLRPGVFTP